MRLRLVHLSLVQSSPDRPGGGDHHPVHELIVVLAGRYAVSTGRGLLRAQPGEAVFFPAGTRHRALLPADRSVHFYVLQWEGGVPLDVRGAVVVADRAARLRFLLDWMWQRRRVPGRDRRGIALLLALAVEELADLLSGDRDADQPDDDVMRRVLRYLEADLHRAPGIAELAAIVGLSSSQLLRRMRRATGLTPSQHLQRLRVAMAVQLLRSTMLRHQEIAERVGLRTSAHLSRLVRRHTGRTPGAVRRHGFTGLPGGRG